MLKLLVKKQFLEMFRSFFYNQKTQRARSAAASVAFVIGYALLMVVVIGGSLGMLFSQICLPLAAAGMTWMYFLMAAMLSLLLGVFGSVFSTFSSLYQARDNDLLLALPIPVRCILISRLLAVYLMGLMFSGVVMLPAILVYWCTVRLSAAAIVCPLVMLLAVSVIVFLLSCALGWVVAKINSKLKNRSFLIALASLAGIGLYYIVYFKLTGLVQELLHNAAVIGAQVKGAAYPLYLFGAAAAGNWPALLGLLAVVAVLFALVWQLLSRTFLKLATASGATAKARYKGVGTKTRRPAAALLAREFRRFTGSANYMLNCGLGTLMMPIAAVLLLVKGGELAAGLRLLLGASSDALPIFAAAALCMLVAMNDSTAPSVSLEGKTLWIVQSLPVQPWLVLRAKLLVQLSLTVLPALLCAGAMAWVLALDAASVALLLAFILSFCVLTACFGLFINLRHVNLTWSSEIYPIKQSMPVTLTLFGGWIYGIALGVGGWRLSTVLPPLLCMGLFAALTAGLAAALFVWLRTRGGRHFAALH